MQIKLFVHIRVLFAYNAYFTFICIFSAYLANFQNKVNCSPILGQIIAQETFFHEICVEFVSSEILGKISMRSSAWIGQPR